MYVSERYCSPQGFCAYKDGDRGLGSWYLFPGALQSTTQSQGVMELALPPTLCTFPAQPRHLKPPLLTAPLSHCGPASCSEDCTWPARPPGSSLPGASDPAPRSALQENHLFWWTSCHQGMGALCLLSLTFYALSPAVNVLSSAPCRSWTASLNFMGGSHWLTRHIARPSLGLQGLPKI